MWRALALNLIIGCQGGTGEGILSGDTGNTGGLPHLHFSLHPCAALPGLPGTGACDSIPVNFRNTSENAVGLLAGRSYLAGDL